MVFDTFHTLVLVFTLVRLGCSLVSFCKKSNEQAYHLTKSLAYLLSYIASLFKIYLLPVLAPRFSLAILCNTSLNGLISNPVAENGNCLFLSYMVSMYLP